MNLRQYILAFFVFLCSVIVAQEKVVFIEEEDHEVERIEKAKLDKEDYIPKIHGVFRTRLDWQYGVPGQTAVAGEGVGAYFGVRNARVSVEGNVLPILGYKAQIDLCDRGEVKMLDAYIRLMPIRGLNISVGQFRIPFSIDAHRGPNNYYFANRSFLGKQVANQRDVGFSLGYTFPIRVPLSIEAGIFNGKGLYDQKDAWTKDFCYSGKLSVGIIDGMKVVLSAKTIKPRAVRINAYDAALAYEIWRFHIEGEYLYKQYENKVFPDAQTANAFVVYNQPLPKVFDCMSFMARYDYVTNHWDGKTDEVEITDAERHRLTVGTTLSLRPFKKENGKVGGVFRDAAKDFRCDLRINYEKYFYAEPGTAKPGEQDKLVAELMLYF